jgi:hypothetical protein
MSSAPTHVTPTRFRPAYLAFGSLRAAKAYVAAEDSADEGRAREAETQRLIAAFARVDIQVHDDYSVTGCTREGRRLRRWAA